MHEVTKDSQVLKRQHVSYLCWNCSSQVIPPYIQQLQHSQSCNLLGYVTREVVLIEDTANSSKWRKCKLIQESSRVVQIRIHFFKVKSLPQVKTSLKEKYLIKLKTFPHIKLQNLLHPKNKRRRNKTEKAVKINEIMNLL